MGDQRQPQQRLEIRRFPVPQRGRRQIVDDVARFMSGDFGEQCATLELVENLLRTLAATSFQIVAAAVGVIQKHRAEIHRAFASVEFLEQRRHHRSGFEGMVEVGDGALQQRHLAVAFQRFARHCTAAMLGFEHPL